MENKIKISKIENMTVNNILNIEYFKQNCNFCVIKCSKVFFF